MGLDVGEAEEGAVYRATHLCTVLCQIQDVERPHIWGSRLVCDMSGVMRTKCLVPGHPNTSRLVYFQTFFTSLAASAHLARSTNSKSQSHSASFFFLSLLSNKRGRPAVDVLAVAAWKQPGNIRGI